jgi:hypothetical protein
MMQNGVMKRMILGGFLLVMSSVVWDANADSIIGSPPKMDCAPLAPKNTPSEEIKTNVYLQIEGISKRLFEGAVGAGGIYTKQDLLAKIPNADKVLVAQLSAYFLCEAARSHSALNLSVVSMFVNQVLPIIDPNVKQKRIIDIRPFPVNGEIDLHGDETKLFDGGQIALMTLVDKSMRKPRALIYLTYTKSDGTTEYIDNKDDGVLLGRTRKYFLPNKRFSLTFKEYFDGTGTAVFQVKKI